MPRVDLESGHSRIFGASRQIKKECPTERGCPSPHNFHHASPEREKPTVAQDWDSATKHNPFPSNRNPRIHPPLLVLSLPSHPQLAAFTPGLNSHRGPELPSSTSNLLVFKTEFVVAATTATATGRLHSRGIHSSFAFRGGVTAGVGYGDRVLLLRP